MERQSKNTLAITVRCAAPVEKVWAEIENWSAQGNWMLSTTVWLTSEQRTGVGTTIAAFTGPLHNRYPAFSALGLLDTMTVTVWEPPLRCEVIHTGAPLKGSGTFLLEATGPHSSLFHWSESIDIHRGLFLIGAPFIWLGVKISLWRFSRLFKN
jgi:hypothetical protein